MYLVGEFDVCESTTNTYTTTDVPGATYEWSINNSQGTNASFVGSPPFSNSVQIFSGTIVGTYGVTVTVTLSEGDPSVCDASTTVHPPVVTDAGPDQTVCAGVSVTLAGSVSGGATAGTWSTSGSGTFAPSATTLNAVYTPSAADITAGIVTLTLTSDNPDGPCDATSDFMVIHINNCAPACNTAYAYSAPAQALCFKDYGFSNWGWTNIIWAQADAVMTWNLYAGNSSCTPDPNKKVGTVEVKYFNNQVTVHYKIDDPTKYSMSEVHVYVGCDRFPKKGNSYTVAPGQYTYNKAGISSTDYTVNFTNVTGSIYIIAHAVTCEVGGTPTALAGSYTRQIACGTLSPPNKSIQITAGLDTKPLTVYPNPFDDEVTFEFVAGKDTKAVLEITNILGQKIATVLDGPVKAGVLNRIVYTPVNVVPGILIYQLVTDDGIQSGRIIYKK